MTIDIQILGINLNSLLPENWASLLNNVCAAMATWLLLAWWRLEFGSRQLPWTTTRGNCIILNFVITRASFAVKCEQYMLIMFWQSGTYNDYMVSSIDAQVSGRKV